MVHPALVVHPQKSQHLESRLSYNIYDVRDEIDIRMLHTSTWENETETTIFWLRSK